jgi:uncharacterized protein
MRRQSVRIRKLFVIFLLASSFVACTNRKLQSELVDAAASGRTADVERLLAQGAPLDGHANDDWTPLTVAAREGHLETVKVLLAKGAAVNAKEGGGHTALFWAQRYGHPDVVRVLLSADGKNE